jgi:uncharacterized delta-60 repeat protein
VEQPLFHRPHIPIAILAAVALLLIPSAAGAREGDLDGSFGSGGTAVTPIGTGGGAANSVAVDAQGRLVVAGYSGGYPNFKIAVARFLPNGALDPSFNGTGYEITPIGTFSRGRSVAIDSQGRIVVAGETGTDFAVLRYLPNGTPDPDFGTAGITTTPFGATSQATPLSVVIDPAGRIVLGGYAYNGSDDDFALARYTDRGQLDSNFGTGGKVVTPVGSNDEINALAIDAQGRIVAAGYAYDGMTTNIRLALARYTDRGDLDSTFGAGGKSVQPVLTGDDEATSVAIDPQGRIVVGSHSGLVPNQEFAVWRFTTDGNPDASFGGGRVVSPIGQLGVEVAANAVAVDAHGRILLAGQAYNGSNTDFALTRYDANGVLDPSFGSGGEVLTPLGSSSGDGASSMTIDAQQRIVLAGYGGSGGFALARYIDDAVAPVVAITSGPKDNAFTRDATPTFGFTVDDPTAVAGCTFDLAAGAACSSPFTPGTRLADGRHTFTVAATDLAGNVGRAQRTFTVDTKRPKLKISGHSRIKTAHKRARARFKLKASEKVTFRCKVDRRRARTCKSKYRTPKLKRGRHKLQVIATDRAGNKTRKVKKFKIVKK